MAGTMVILDTCILIELQRGNKSLIERIYKLDLDQLFVTPIVIAEFYRGARNKEEFIKCRKLADKFDILSLNSGVVTFFTDIFLNYSLSNRPAIPDMLIAAAALYHDCSIFTLNKKDFSFIPQLHIIE